MLRALACLLLATDPSTADGTAGAPLVLTVEAGPHDRKDTPVAIEIPADRLPTDLLARGPIGLAAREVREGAPPGGPVVIQAERPSSATDAVRLSFILAGETRAGARRRFRWDGTTTATGPSAWSLADGPEGSLELRQGPRTVFRYNRRPITHPNYDRIQHRDAYIHPAFTPSGALITGDYSKAHTHHRGFFLAYAKADVGDLHPDFWNIHARTGKVHFERMIGTTVGPVVARFAAEHRWEAQAQAGPKPVLRERWDVEAIAVPDAPYWLFDLTSTQRAIDEPVKLVPYRYGGMAYRGPDSFLPPNVLDVLTSEGLGRKDGDQKPARWVDLTGPVAGGASDYAGAMVADHPSNPHHPTVARIHPTTLPFFTYVPAHDESLTIRKEEPIVFRYRILIHDGRPDRDLDERIWRDFAGPPKVAVDAG